MLADQFFEAATGARTTAALDETARLLWRAHTEGHIDDTEAMALSEAIEERRGSLTGQVQNKPAEIKTATTGAPRACRRASGKREKMFGEGRPRPLDRNAKARIMHLARCLSRRTEKGRAYGTVTAKALSVLEVLLWVFHNAKSGLCFPSYETIAEAAGCARSTVAEAIKALEDAGVSSWVNRLKRVAEATIDLFGHCTRKTRVIRTSNGYDFIDPQPSKKPEPFNNCSKSDFQSGTSNQESILNKRPQTPPVSDPHTSLGHALLRLSLAIGLPV